MTGNFANHNAGQGTAGTTVNIMNTFNPLSSGLESSKLMSSASKDYRMEKDVLSGEFTRKAKNSQKNNKSTLNSNSRDHNRVVLDPTTNIQILKQNTE